MKISEVWRENRPPRRSRTPLPGTTPKTNKGILSLYRLVKRQEAEKRNAEYRALVEKTMTNHNISEKEAKRVLRGVSRVDRAKAAKRKVKRDGR